MKYQTSTFTYKESDPEHIYYSIHYCSYCGSKANREDIGSSHNHRWEEYIIHYCNCKDATKEIELKEKLASLKREQLKIEHEIDRMKQLEDNEIVNGIKFNIESGVLKSQIDKLKTKYQIK